MNPCPRGKTKDKGLFVSLACWPELRAGTLWHLLRWQQLSSADFYRRYIDLKKKKTSQIISRASDQIALETKKHLIIPRGFRAVTFYRSFSGLCEAHQLARSLSLYFTLEALHLGKPSAGLSGWPAVRRRLARKWKQTHRWCFTLTRRRNPLTEYNWASSVPTHLERSDVGEGGCKKWRVCICVWRGWNVHPVKLFFRWICLWGIQIDDFCNNISPRR